MKPINLLFCSLILLCSGCISSKDMAKIVKELGNDPATVNIRVTTIYGTLTLTRTNPNTNTLPHSVQSEGIVNVGGK